MDNTQLQRIKTFANSNLKIANTVKCYTGNDLRMI